MLRHLRLLIFDLDYLLFDCAALKIRAVREALVPFADRIPHDVRLPDAIDAEEGFIEFGRHWSLVLRNGFGDELLDELQQSCRANEQRLAAAGLGGVYPGLYDFLVNSRKELTLAIGAEAHRDYLLAVSDQHNLDRVFEITYCTEEVGLGSAEEMLEDILQRAEVCPSEAVALGTRAEFFQAARNLDLLSIGCGWGLHHHEKLAEADLQAPSLAQLNAVLLKADMLAARSEN